MDRDSSDTKYAEDLDIPETTHVVHHLAFNQEQADTAAGLLAGKDIELDAAEARRIRRKIDWHVMPLMCSTLTPHSFLPKTFR
jgi:MFS transporter, ACS family, allantoate permease